MVTYRARSAVRDVARALGYAPGQQDAFSKAVERRLAPVGDAAAALPADVAALADAEGLDAHAQSVRIRTADGTQGSDDA